MQQQPLHINRGWRVDNADRSSHAVQVQGPGVCEAVTTWQEVAGTAVTREAPSRVDSRSSHVATSELDWGVGTSTHAGVRCTLR